MTVVTATTKESRSTKKANVKVKAKIGRPMIYESGDEKKACLTLDRYTMRILELIQRREGLTRNDAARAVINPVRRSKVQSRDLRSFYRDEFLLMAFPTEDGNPERLKPERFDWSTEEDESLKILAMDFFNMDGKKSLMFRVLAAYYAVRKLGVEINWEYKKSGTMKIPAE